MKITPEELKNRIYRSLSDKVDMAECVIEQWYGHWDGKVYVSFSGGRDSTALLHLVRNIFPDVPAVFLDTGLEYPEIRDFVKTIENVIWIRPKMSFQDVIGKYGYPVISKEVSRKLYDIRTTSSEKLKMKRMYGDGKGNGKLSDKWKFLIHAPFNISDKCCDALKKRPIQIYERETGRKGYLGTRIEESRLRATHYLLNGGCNAYQYKRPVSAPLSLWTDQNVLDYIQMNGLPYASIYDKGEIRTGCMFCMFGIAREKGCNKFQRMKIYHPKQYEYCMNDLGLDEVLTYIGIPH